MNERGEWNKCTALYTRGKDRGRVYLGNGGGKSNIKTAQGGSDRKCDETHGSSADCGCGSSKEDTNVTMMLGGVMEVKDTV